MLEYTIDGTVYKFNAGFAFIREAQKLHKDAAGNENGLMFSMAGVIDREPERLRDVLLAMNSGQDPRVTADNLEKWIEEHEDLEAVFADVSGFFKSANCTKTAWSKLETLVKLATAAKG